MHHVTDLDKTNRTIPPVFDLQLIDCPTVMHICLQIPEILTKIFASYDYDEENIKTLYFLALACKMFHEPARDALWRFQQSFVILLKMFPADLWDEMADPDVAVSRCHNINKPSS